MAVVGGGIAGLAAADYLREHDFAPVVFDAADEAGGRMRTIYSAHRVPIDLGVKIFSIEVHREIMGLLRRHGLLPTLRPLQANPFALVRNRRVHTIGGGSTAMLRGSLLDWRGKLGALRLARDIATSYSRYDADHPERSPLAGMSISDLGRRYSGNLRDNALASIAAGVFSMSPDHAGASALINQFLAVHGALGRGMVYLANGMGSLTQVLSDKLDVRCRVTVDRIAVANDKYELASGADRVGQFDGVVLAVPTPALRRIATPTLPRQLTDFVAASDFSQQLQLVVEYRAEAPIPFPPDAYGVVFRPLDRTGLAWFSQEDVKHGRRNQETGAVIHLGLTPDEGDRKFSWHDEDIVDIGLRRLSAAFPGAAENVASAQVIRLGATMPYLGPAALAIRSAFCALRPARLEIAGDWVYSPSSEGAVRSGHRAARRVMSAIGIGHNLA